MGAIYCYRDGIAFVPAILLLLVMQILIVRPSPEPALSSRKPIEITLLATAVEEQSPSPPQPPAFAQPVDAPVSPSTPAVDTPTPIAPIAAASRPAVKRFAETLATPPPSPAPRSPRANPVAGPAGVPYSESAAVEKVQARPDAPVSPSTPAVDTPTTPIEPIEAASQPEVKHFAETPVAESPTTPPPSAAPQPPRANPVADLEVGYVAQVRQMLNAIKRYPTGREASLLRPSGTVRVWLVLDRNGQLLERGIEISSQSLLLDNAALRTVSGASYPPFPEGLWPGQDQHRFHVDIDFVVPNG